MCQTTQNILFALTVVPFSLRVFLNGHTFPFTIAMVQLSLHVVLLMFKWLPVACYSYQSESLFMTFSQLAALEAESKDRSATTVSPSESSESLHMRSVVVKCLQDSMEVKVAVEKAEAFGLGFPIDPQFLNLGPVVQSQRRCQAEFTGDGAYAFRALHGECGTKLTVRLLV